MLLQRLVEYATSNSDAPPPFHRERAYQWQLELNTHGALRSSRLTALAQPDARGRLRGVVHATPSVVRTVGVAPNLAADDVQYVLGWSDPQTRTDRVAQCHTAFTDLAYRWADSELGRDDTAAQAIATFYRSGGDERVEKPDEFTAKQGVLIAVNGRPAYRAPSVIPFWAAEVTARKGGSRSGLCLVCGRQGPLLDTVPGKVRSSLVPGASNDTALISVNERVFGYDLSTQLTHTPLCITCGEAVTSGLIAILSSHHTMSYGGQDSRMAWWLTEPQSFDLMTVLQQPNSDEVLAWRRAIAAGEALPATTAGHRAPAFCSLSIGGNVARIMVRDWLEMPLTDLYTNLQSWLDDHETATRWHDGRRHHGVAELVLVTGRWLRTRNKYAEFGAKGADRPAQAQRDLIRAAIRGAIVPPSLLAHVVHRVQSDGHLDDARAALLRLCLVRSPLTTENPMPDLDPTNTDPAYVAGRIFAVLEQIQYDASGGNLNTTYGDRYFAGAVSNPRAAIVNGRKDAKAWLKKLRRSGKAYWYEQALDELFSLVDTEPGLPSRTTLRQQATFLLGYHQQRAHRMAQIRAHDQGAGGTEARRDDNHVDEELTKEMAR